MSRLQPIVSNRASGGTGGYTPALRAGDFVYVSGQGPLDPQTLAVLGDDRRRADDAHAAQRPARWSRPAAATPTSIVRCTCYLASIDLFDEFTAAYERFFAHEPRPTRTTIGCELAGILVEIDCVAYVPQRIGWLSRCEPRPASGSRRTPTTWSSSRARSSRTAARTGRRAARRRACQAFVADYLRGLGLEPDVFQPDEVAGALEHPAWWPGRDYAGRPNVVARLEGRGRRPLAALLRPRRRRPRPRRRRPLLLGRRGRGRAAVRPRRARHEGRRRVLPARAALPGRVRPAARRRRDRRDDRRRGVRRRERHARLPAARLRRRRGGARRSRRGSRSATPPAAGSSTGCTRAAARAGWTSAAAPRPSALVTLAQAAVALAAAEPGRGAPIYQFLLQSGEQLPWGTAEGTPTDGVLEFWAEILPGYDPRAMLEDELRGAVGRATAGRHAARVGAAHPVPRRRSPATRPRRS